ncbi:hypothetical protein H7849_08370 [Alloacidobacterium dinghuense]|uniref:Tetratricopeptide repeat protein n=1 Tax=Alloacidobacterium dinghuense TaxID=2763107 RepID=A0A7G8BMY7_9BACT|nr:hypothetical protein [Alloacidobacterium dinghuense]QNI33907.1 hypothetical protein H7849_08370 [Alloacidobacterium dinghuense]
MKKVVVASVLAVATGTAFYLPAALALDDDQAQGAQSSQLTIKDPAEYNAYTNAVGQSAPAAKASAIEQFLTQYPNSVAKEEMLQQLMAAYEQAGQADKEVDAANRLLQVNPNNLRALTIVVYMEKKQTSDQSKLDDAAAKAKTALAAPKPPGLSDADYEKLKAATTPIFYDAEAVDASAKKDYKSAVEAYTAELKAYGDPAQTQAGPGLLATYNLGNAYVSQDPKDLVNGVWFLTRAAQYAPAGYKDQIEKAAEYWYKKYHCAQTDTACQTNVEGYAAIQQMAKANLFPPDTYKPVAAPPPPSPQELAHQAVTSTPDLKTLALADKEFILANGTPEDAGKVWDVLKDVTAEVPGTVVSATPDTVQLAVSEDAKASQKADFTVNMKAPLKEVPQAGAQVKFTATFDSYTQNPPMIILKDGEPPAAAKKPAAHRPVHHPSGK